MAEVDYKVARLRRTLLIIILSTIPLYLLGVIVLWVASASVDINKPTATLNVIYVTATSPATATDLPPTKFPTKTAGPTSTRTPTRTVTVTPSLTPTETHTPVPTETSTPEPTFTNTPVPPSETPTTQPTP
jgi:hypothetical protein